MLNDVIIIGGSYAGISAGLQLARARRRILVIDAGVRRNRTATASHGFLGQDGKDPAAIAAQGRKELQAYPTVRWIDGSALSVKPATHGFMVQDSAGDCHESKRILLATGIKDELPAIPGLPERWGRSVFHCPYCHGYELNQGAIGVIATSALSMHHALMLPDWGPTTFFINGTFELNEEQQRSLSARGVVVELSRIVAVEGVTPTVRLADGRTLTFAGLFTASKISAASPLVTTLGCAMEESPAGPFIKTDMRKETTVPGVFACGDAARPFGNVALAVGDGSMAGSGIHQSLLFG